MQQTHQGANRQQHECLLHGSHRLPQFGVLENKAIASAAEEHSFQPSVHDPGNFEKEGEKQDGRDAA